MQQKESTTDNSAKVLLIFTVLEDCVSQNMHIVNLDSSKIIVLMSRQVELEITCLPKIKFEFQ